MITETQGERFRCRKIIKLSDFGTIMYEIDKKLILILHPSKISKNVVVVGIFTSKISIYDKELPYNGKELSEEDQKKFNYLEYRPDLLPKILDQLNEKIEPGEMDTISMEIEKSPLEKVQ